MVPRPHVVCPSCGELHQQTGSTTVCHGCRIEDDPAGRRLAAGARAGINARKDFDAVFRFPREPFAQAFVDSFFRRDGLFPDGMEPFALRLRDAYSERVDQYRTRADERYREGFNEGRSLGYAEGVRAASPATPEPQPLTGDLLRRVIALCHPDRHPPERSEEANEVTAFLLLMRDGGS